MNKIKGKINSRKLRYWSQKKGGQRYENAVFAINAYTILKNIFEIKIAQEKMPHGKVLDVGCGTGRIALALARGTSRKILAVDASQSMLSVLQKKIDYERLHNIKIKKIKIEKLDYLKQKFDGCTCITVIRHFENWDYILKLISKKIKKNGTFLFEMPNNENYEDFIRTWQEFQATPTENQILNVLHKNKLKIIFSQNYDFLNNNQWLISKIGMINYKILIKILTILLQFNFFASCFITIEKKLSRILPAKIFPNKIYFVKKIK